MTAIERKRLPPGLLSGLLFFTVVLLGCVYIFYAKLQDIPAFYVTSVPVGIMLGYAALLGFARLFRLRDDQSGDNLYYMGFLFTLTSLAVSLYQFSSHGSAEQIVQNFGVAVASTIAGIALRIFFNQMRRDPIEVEHVARLELADAARRVKRELESTILEFSYFRRSTQQSISDAVEEIQAALQSAREKFVFQLQEFAETSSAPIKAASERSSETMENFNKRAAEAVEGAAQKVVNESDQLSRSTAAIVQAIDALTKKLAATQTPEQIIEIKLNPALQGISRAVNAFAKSAEDQASAARVSVEQTQSLTRSVAAALEKVNRLEAALKAQADLQGKLVESNAENTQRVLDKLTVVIDRIADAERMPASGAASIADPPADVVVQPQEAITVGRRPWTIR